jgi:hypothetical protein
MNEHLIIISTEGRGMGRGRKGLWLGGGKGLWLGRERVMVRGKGEEGGEELRLGEGKVYG